MYCLKIKIKNSYLREGPLGHFALYCTMSVMSKVFFFDDQKRDINVSSNKALR